MLPNGLDTLLRERLLREDDERVALEICGSAAKLGFLWAFEEIMQRMERTEREDLRMEVVLILSEIRHPRASELLQDIAERNGGSELRQAAVWGLGRNCNKQYENIVRFLSDPEDNVVLHAITSFGDDASVAVIEEITNILVEGNPRAAPAAREALSLIGSESAVRVLSQRFDLASATGKSWILSTLGKFRRPILEPILTGSPIFILLQPMLTLSPDVNWLARRANAASLDFLIQQTI